MLGSKKPVLDWFNMNTLCRPLAQIVNIGSDTVNLKISVSGLTHTINSLSSSTTILTSGNVMDENSFLNPTKVNCSLTLISWSHDN
jgi:hypothetical protein